MKDYSENTLFQRKNELLSSRMDNETVMMSPESGKYFSLNPVATRIWELLEKPHSINNLVQILVAEFDVQPEVCKKETSDFIYNLIEKEIVEVK